MAIAARRGACSKHGGMADRLKTATSPYLLQHADNPVDWWPWSAGAFAAARERDVPMMLSVGYSACHWCHVMAHESFEDPQTAALLNENLVSIKVDREERPDVDAVYMTATQAMTGQGGWPMTVFMTPEGEPFYCGTYFPRAQFQHLVLAIAKAWHEDRDGVTGQAGRIAAALGDQARPWPGDAETASPVAARVARETCAWMIRELRTSEGGLASALDADSDGEEGLFYTWTPGELREALGAEDAGYAAEVFGVTPDGTFERGRSVLQRRGDPADEARLRRVSETLLAARAKRVRPGRDDKVVTAWNGLAIAALAECGLLLREPGFVTAALEAADLLTALHLADGRLRRTSRAGEAGPGAGGLDDYACLADGFLTLSGVTGQARWMTLPGDLLETALTHFGDGNGGFYDTAHDGQPLLYRPADPADGPSPSGAFAAAGALLSYAALAGSSRHRDAAV